MIDKIMKDLARSVRNTEELMQRKKSQIENDIANVGLPLAQTEIEINAFTNLTNYGATGSQPRDKRIREAFQLLEDLVGFEWETKGSFTSQGARNILEKDMDSFRGKRNLSIEISGKLKELETGQTNWKNLRRFFHSNGVKTRIKLLYPSQWEDIYDRLDSLFKQTQDPTMPEGRPYIRKAAEKGAEYLHESIKWSIHRSFDRKGRWRDALGRYA